ncbi:protein kinase [bacterium]|nr:protein kinase [candidate division CSSED10-310 bacterium]
MDQMNSTAKDFSSGIADALPQSYRLAGELGKGGMGIVYLVEQHLLGRNQQYAVKMILPEMMKESKRQQAFIRELRTWIDLPEHPHLVRCFFWKTLDQRLAIFSEYINGGSLRDAIRSKRLRDVNVILDIAIQTAWGLECAHQWGVVHQDVKPHNILINLDGEAKITDFGISSVRFAGGMPKQLADNDSTLWIESEGITWAYCSPEQAAGKNVSRRTDIWSFGLTILEMFTGKVTWRFGCIVEPALNAYLSGESSSLVPSMPDGLPDILKKCFQEDLSKRYKTMSDVSDDLIEVYQKTAGHPYFRNKPSLSERQDMPEAKADRSTFKGHTWEDPDIFLDKALKESKKLDRHIPTNKKTPGSSRKAQSLADLEKYEKASSIFEFLVNQGRHDLWEYSFKSRYYKGLILSRCEDYQGSIDEYSKAVHLLKEESRNCPELEKLKNLSDCYSKIAGCCLSMNRYEESLEYNSISLKLIQDAFHLDTSLAEPLISEHLNRGAILNYFQKYAEAIMQYDTAIALSREFHDSHSSDDYRLKIARINHNKAVALYNLESDPETLKVLDEVILVLDDSVFRSGDYEAANCLANTCFLKGMVFRRAGNLDESQKHVRSAIAVFQEQIEQHNREELYPYLADAMTALSEMQFAVDKSSEAISTMKRAADIFEDVLLKGAEPALRRIFASIHISLSLMILSDPNANVSRSEIRKAVDIIRQMMEETSADQTIDLIEDIAKEIAYEISLASPPDRVERYRAGAEFFLSMIKKS